MDNKAKLLQRSENYSGLDLEKESPLRSRRSFFLTSLFIELIDLVGQFSMSDNADIASYGLAWSVFPFQFGYFLAKDSPLVNDIEVIGTE